MTDKDPKVVSFRAKGTAGEPPEDGWRGMLLYGERGPRPVVSNAIVLLTEHPLWKGKLVFCERRKMPVLLDAAGPLFEPGQWIDAHTNRFIAWAEHCLEGDEKSKFSGINFTSKIINPTIIDVSLRTRIDPVKQYLESVAWDGIARINHLLIDHAGAPDEPWVEEVTRKWMISAVARVASPGCQVDTVLALEGPQGGGKTSFFRALGGDWASEHIGALGSRDSVVEMSRSWIVELADIASLKRTKEIEAVKAFVTRRVDHFVDKYDKFTTSWPRAFIFGASVNPTGAGWIGDSTGGRRFWPIAVKIIDWRTIAGIRNQLWAEAAAAYNDGESWHLSPGETATRIEQEQRNRITEEVWQRPIEEFTTSKTCVLVGEVLDLALSKPKSDQTKGDAMRVAEVLKTLGFSRKENVIREGKKGCWWVRDE